MVYILPAGQHKDKKITDVPLDYLLWMSQQRDLFGSRTLPQKSRELFDRKIAKLKERWSVGDREITALLPDGRILHVGEHIMNALMSRSKQAPAYEQVLDPMFYVDKPYTSNVYIEGDPDQPVAEFWYAIGISKRF